MSKNFYRVILWVTLYASIAFALGWLSGWYAIQTAHGRENGRFEREERPERPPEDRPPMCPRDEPPETPPTPPPDTPPEPPQAPPAVELPPTNQSPQNEPPRDTQSPVETGIDNPPTGNVGRG